MNKDLRCKTCKNTYEVHISYIFETWDYNDPNQYTKANKILEECNRFQAMNNLELLEYEAERKENATRT